MRNNTCACKYEGATFDKATKDGKGQRSRFFQLVDVEGTQTIRWTGTNTIARRLSRPLDGEDRSIKLTEVKRVLHFKEPGTKRGTATWRRSSAEPPRLEKFNTCKRFGAHGNIVLWVSARGLGAGLGRD